MPFGSKGLRQLLDSPGARNFGLGVGAAMLGYLLWPVARRAVRPVFKGAIKGALLLGDRVQELAARAREGLEDLVAEAQFERVREGMGPEAGAAPDAPALEPPAPPQGGQEPV